MFAYPLKCGNCNNLVDFVFNAPVDHRERTPEEINALATPDHLKTIPSHNRQILGLQAKTDKDKVHASTHSHCPRCNHPTLIIYECSRVAHESIKQISIDGEGSLFGGSSCVTIIEYYPKPKLAEQDPNWPDNLRRQFADAQDMLWEGKTPSIILATARTVLELALKKLDDTTGQTLYKRIETLHSNGIITTPIKDWAHDIRLDGNDATHDGIGEEEMAKEYIEFLKLFLNMTFSLPKRIEEKRKFSDVK